MPRQSRRAPGGVIYHVLNRAAGKAELFRSDADYAAFIKVLAETMERTPIRLCAYCLMPTHWHLVLWPQEDGQLAQFMQRLTITHVRRWVEFRNRVGLGAVYQGRYKSFPIQDDAHFTTVVRYVERNPLRAGKVRRAERWLWSSLNPAGSGDIPQIPLSRWPVSRRSDWLEWVNQPQTKAEEEAVRRSLQYSRPYGAAPWTARMETLLKIGPLRPPGRPRNEPKVE
ncbi:MAG: rayT [Phycisphaerales bacterium]|jgi:putative transposase|nr:rayT [Phycisphaerales bacterium]